MLRPASGTSYTMSPLRPPASASVRPADLLRLWNERADFLQEYGDANGARLWRLAAVELERALEAFGAEALTLAEAEQVSGYSARYIGKLIAAGEIPNAGRKNAPRVRRADLRVKALTGPGRPPRRPDELQQNGDDIVAAIVEHTPITTKRRTAP